MSELAQSNVDRDVEEGSARAAVEQPMIHEQAYWDRDIDQLVERWSQLKVTAMQERTDVEKAEWDSFMWQNFLQLREMVMQLALEKFVVPEAKPARKRTAKVPKPALPELPESDTEAA